jgi:hypothetical protein
MILGAGHCNIEETPEGTQALSALKERRFIPATVARDLTLGFGARRSRSACRHSTPSDTPRLSVRPRNGHICVMKALAAESHVVKFLRATLADGAHAVTKLEARDGSDLAPSAVMPYQAPGGSSR